MKWYELAEQRRKQLELSQTDLADMLNVTQGAIGNWLNNRRTPELDVIMKILSSLGIDTLTLDKNANVVLDESCLKTTLTTASNISIIGMLDFSGAKNRKAELEPIEKNSLNYISNDHRAFAIKVKGTLLEPKIVNGEYIVVEPSITYQGYDEVLIKRKDGTYEVKIFIGERGDDYRFLDINTGIQSRTDDIIPKDDIEEMSYIAAVMKPQRSPRK